MDIGRVAAGEPGNQIVVDIDKADWGKSPLAIFSGDGELLARFNTRRSRHHDLVRWHPGGIHDIAVAADCAVYSASGDVLARWAMGPQDQPADVCACDLTGDGRADLLVSTRYGTAACLYRNPGLCEPEGAMPRGTGLNFTLY